MVIINEIFEEGRRNPNMDLLSDALEILTSIEVDHDGTETGKRIGDLVKRIERRMR